MICPAIVFGRPAKKTKRICLGGSTVVSKGAEILPTVCALYRAGGEPEQLASSDEALRLMLRSIREGYQVLRANGVPITPGIHRVFEWLPESFLLFLMRRMVKSETTAIKPGHAAQGRAEWRVLAEEFRSLVHQESRGTREKRTAADGTPWFP